MMKCPWFARVTLLAASSLVLFSASPAQAQASDYSRVVRLSRTEGQVLVSRPGSDAWEEATVNLPLQEGDSLATQSGFAEIEFENGATAYLAENSILQFTQLAFSGGGRVTQLTLTQGAGTFYANLTSQDSFGVRTSTFEVAIPERAEVRVDAFRDGASVQVLLGDVSVSTSAGSTNLEKGQSVAIHEGDLQNLNVARLPNPDSFDQWVSAQSETIQSGTKNTLSYVSSPSYYGLSDLSIYGSWVNFPGYGMSWRPFRVGTSWTPYMNGNWILDPRLGWIWVSNEPWGWMPFHFGSWLLSPTLGWVWCPGGRSGLRHWEGARVHWVHAGNQVGWVAMSPRDRDGVPENLEHGVMTRPDMTSRNTNGPNQIVAGQQLRNAAPLKQPPADFASRPAPGAPRSGFTSATRAGSAWNPPIIRTIPQPSESDEAIVFDRRTHTFVNGNGGNGRATPAALMPPSNARTEISRVMIPPPGPMDSQIRRVILPPAGPAPPSRMLVNSVNPPANMMSVPPIARPGFNPQPGQAAPPRPVSPPPAPQTPHSAPQFSSAPRPAAPTPESARPAAGVMMQRH
jgi:uncharacterized protein DUF6600/FecR-like protein